MKRIACVLIFLMVLGTFVGCNTTSDVNKVNADERVLKVRKRAAVMSTDWEKTTESEDMQIAWVQLFEGLYGINEAQGGYIKLLADDIKISDDQLHYTIKLVDAKFQNGDKLKASDVVFSYERAMANPRFNYVTSMIESIEAKDDKTVVFNLKYPYSPIEHTFFSIKIASEKEVTTAGDDFGTAPHTAGTGPYIVTEFNMATGMKLKAFDDYWRGAPRIKNVEYVVITEDSAAVIAMENGELDYLHAAPLSEWDILVKATGEENSYIAVANNITCISLNWESKTNNSILANELVRKAICYAIDKDNLNLAITKNRGVIATEYMPSNYVATSPKSSDGGFELYTTDKEKAKGLLKQAGFTDEQLKEGIDIGTILSYGSQTSEKAKVAQVLQANLAEVGLKVGVEILDISIAASRMHNYDYDIALFTDSGNYDFNNIRQQVHSESVGMAVIRYRGEGLAYDKGARIEELVDLGVKTSDVEERVEYYTELWSMVQDTATLFPLFHGPVGICWSEDVVVDDKCPTYYHIYSMGWK